MPNQFVDATEPTLRGVAEMTGGEYTARWRTPISSSACSTTSRDAPYGKTSGAISVYSLLGALFVITAFGLSMWWNRSP